MKPEKTGKKQDTKFKKGQSGNPNGRPKGAGISITTEIKKKLEEVPDGRKATYLQLLINRILKGAIQDGDNRIIELIWKYCDGSPEQFNILMQDNRQVNIYTNQDIEEAAELWIKDNIDKTKEILKSIAGTV